MTNPFTKSANEARERGEKALALRITNEGRVVGRLVKHALASGYTVSVNDGEEWVVKKSTKQKEIIDACYSTDEDVLLFRKDGAYMGRVMLVYGNCGYDVISDYGAPDEAALEAFSAWMKPVDDYAESLEDGRVSA